MPDDEVFQPLEGTLKPPNGDRVTQAALYKALYDMDQGLSRRFTVFLEIVAGLREDLEEHRADGHPKARREETVRAEINLDAKKAAVAAGLIAFATAAVVLVTAGGI